MTDLSVLWTERERLQAWTTTETFARSPAEQQDLVIDRLIAVTDALADAVPTSPEDHVVKSRLLVEYAEQLEAPEQNYITRIARSLESGLALAACGRAPPGCQTAA